MSGVGLNGLSAIAVGDFVKRKAMNLGALNSFAGSVQAAVRQIAHQFEVDYVTLHLFRGGDDAKNNPYVRTNYPDAWVSHYLLNDYVRIDPVLQKAKTTAAPFCWSTMVLAPEQQAMMKHAIEHGLGQTGFSVTHVDAMKRHSVLSFNAHHARGTENWEPFLKENGDQLDRLVLEMHEKAIAELLGDGKEVILLSPRETECLKWTAEGKTHTEIAVILNLSEHTVRSYLKDARIKLDSVTLAQAVSNASALGLI